MSLGMSLLFKYLIQKSLKCKDCWANLYHLKNSFLLKLIRIYLFEHMKAIPCRKLQENWIFYTTVCISTFTEKKKLALTKAKKKKCEALMHSKAREQVQLVLRIKKLTHPQMWDSLYSTCKKKKKKKSTVKDNSRFVAL